jgi:peptidoglycan/LPS O-acetylase OafA/YrhL
VYLSYIDGIRAIAVLSVFIYHLNPNILPGGFAGVDVFFVVSGYVVSLSLDRYKDVSLPAFLAIFYSRRLKRIVPALLFCLLISVVFATLFIPASSLTRSHAKTALYAFFGLSNIVLSRGNNDYFGPAAEFNPFTHTWSLGVEEQFYVIFPFIFVLWTSTRKSHHKKLAAIIYTALLILSLAISIWYSQTNKLHEYYLITSRFWQLASGILLYQFVKSRHEAKLDRFRPWFYPISFAAAGLLIGGLFISDVQHFPMPWALTVVIGTFLLLLSMHYVDGGAVRALLNIRPLRLIGKWSYSLYLWHWPVIVLFKWTVGIDAPLKIAAVVLITVTMSCISYYFIENPVRTSAAIAAASRKRVIATALAIVVFSALIGNLLYQEQERYTFSITRQKSDWDPDDVVFDSRQAVCSPTSTKAPLKTGSKRVYSCADDKISERKIFMFGDSHAGAYKGMLKQFTADTGVESHIYTLFGCGDMSSTPLAKLDEGCRDFLTAAFEDINSQAGAGDVIFLASLKLKLFTNSWGIGDVDEAREMMVSKESGEDRRIALRDNLALLEPLTERGVSVIYEAPKPIFKSPAFRCAKWYNVGNPVCRGGLEIDREELLDYRQPVMDNLESIETAMRNTYVYDPFEVLCPGNVCKAIVDSKPLVFDSHHLSGYGVLTVYPDFKRFMTDRDLLTPVDQPTTAN